MEISIKMGGFSQLYKNLDYLGQAAPKVGQQKIRSALVRAKEAARTYPAHSSDYKRTKTYYKSFKVVKISDGWSLQSDAISPRGRAYTVYVGGDENGGGMSWNTRHWPIIKDVVDAETDGLVVELDVEFQRLLDFLFAQGG